MSECANESAVKQELDIISVGRGERQGLQIRGRSLAAQRRDGQLGTWTCGLPLRRRVVDIQIQKAAKENVKIYGMTPLGCLTPSARSIRKLRAIIQTLSHTIHFSQPHYIEIYGMTLLLSLN